MSNFKTIQNVPHGTRQSVNAAIKFVVAGKIGGANEGSFVFHLANMPTIDETKSPLQVITLSKGEVQQLANSLTSGSIPSLIATINAAPETSSIRMDMLACYEGESYLAYDKVTTKVYKTTHWNTELYTITLDDDMQAKMTDASIQHAIRMQQQQFEESMVETLSIGEKIAKRKKAERARIAALETIGETPEPANNNSDPSDDNDDDDDES